MYYLEFIQSRTDSPAYGDCVHHLSADYLKNNLSLSPRRVSSLSYFTTEPRRLSFDCFANDWLR